MSAASHRTAVLFAWLNEVKADTSLPASAFKVAFELGQWINREAFEKEAVLTAWPSLETIGAAIVMSERTARDMVGRLESRGHLEIKVGHGPGHPSRYTFVMQNRQSASAFRRAKPAVSFRIGRNGNRPSASAFRRAKPAVQRPETGRTAS